MEEPLVKYPPELLKALYENKLVIFAGAGVSMGKPACLPDFHTLACKIDPEQEPENGETIPVFLERLKGNGVDVHGQAAKIIKAGGGIPTHLHRDLLRCFPEKGLTRLITTNFDHLFEVAAKCRTPDQTSLDVYRLPKLPREDYHSPDGPKFNGIVHLHGDVAHPDSMVLTDQDYRRAYAEESEAWIFLADILASCPVVFLGYSHNDVFVKHLENLLSAHSTHPRWLLTGEHDRLAEDQPLWQELGYEFVKYPQQNTQDHSAAAFYVEALATLLKDYARERERISKLARSDPPAEGRDAEMLVKYFLAGHSPDCFTKQASSLQWVVWLDQRGILGALFDPHHPDPDPHWSQWLADRFMFSQANTLFSLFRKHGLKLHLCFWRRLVWELQEQHKSTQLLDDSLLTCWISLLLDTMPRDESDLLQGILIEVCTERGMQESLLEIHYVLSQRQLELCHRWESHTSARFSWGGASEIRWDENKYHFDSLRKGMKPSLHQFAPVLLRQMVGLLDRLHIIWTAWLLPNARSYDSTFLRPAIPELPSQLPKDFPGGSWSEGEAWFVNSLLGSACECLYMLARSDQSALQNWCGVLIGSEAPLLRRLAIYGLSLSANLNADDKTMWLLAHADLGDEQCHFELFRVVGQCFPDARKEVQKRFVEAVRSCHGQYAFELTDLHIRFEWFYWLSLRCPESGAVKEALADIEKKDRGFERRGDPSLPCWMDQIRERTLESPWTPDELLSKSAREWLLPLRSVDLTEDSSMNLVKAVHGAALQSFTWSMELADAFLEIGEWQSGFWFGLLLAWSEMGLSPEECRIVLDRLENCELDPVHSSAKTHFLLSLTYVDKPYELDLFRKALGLAESWWEQLDPIELSKPTLQPHEFCSIRYHPAQILTLFWLRGIEKYPNPGCCCPPVDFFSYLSRLLTADSGPALMGRMVLFRNLGILIKLDEEWVKSRLMPLLSTAQDKGALVDTWIPVLKIAEGQPDLAVLRMLREPLARAVPFVCAELYEDTRNLFMTFCDFMRRHFPDDSDRWLDLIVKFGSVRDKRVTAMGRKYQGPPEEGN